jgi:uncharacterized membrane protein YedE/YeeE
MKYIKFLLVGIIFGMVLVKSEAVSWYRIYEMFKFESFHMYGIIGTAVITGIILLLIAKKLQIKNTDGKVMNVPPKERGLSRYLIGGTLFGLGWALSGACPGPMVVNIGYGFLTMAIVFAFALIGTFLYGVIMHKLPH